MSARAWGLQPGAPWEALASMSGTAAGPREDREGTWAPRPHHVTMGLGLLYRPKDIL